MPLASSTMAPLEHLGEREGAHDEAVVAVVALQAQLGLVGVDDELVVARAALRDQRGVRAGAQPAAGGGDQGREDVGRREAAFGDVALGAEDLPDLEAVVVGAAVEGDDRRRVVGEERVVAAAAVDGQAAVEGAVVVDPLDEGARLVAGDRVAVAVEVVAAGAARARCSRARRRCRPAVPRSPGGRSARPGSTARRAAGRCRRPRTWSPPAPARRRSCRGRRSRLRRRRRRGRRCRAG